MADIRNGGDFAFGFDPDCHYFNNGITLTITAIPASTPESPSIMLLGSGLLVSMTVTVQVPVSIFLDKSPRIVYRMVDECESVSPENAEARGLGESSSALEPAQP